METGISSACRGHLAPGCNNLPTISTQCTDIVMKTFVDRSRDIQGPDSPDWLCTLVCSKLIHLKSFVLRCAEFFPIDNLCYSKIFSSYYWWGVNSYNDYRCSSCFIPQFFRSFLCLPVLLYRFSISVCLVNAIENNKLQTSYLKCKVCLLCPS